MTKRAVLVSLSEDDAGLLLSLDDVISDDEQAWTKAAHYAREVFSNSAVENLAISEKELADFGLAILARMHAFPRESEN